MYHFPSFQRIPVYISYKAGLLAQSSLNFLLFEKISLFPSPLKDDFTGDNPTRFFFRLSRYFSPLSSRVASDVTPALAALYIAVFRSGVFQDLFRLVFYFLQFEYAVAACFFGTYPAWSSALLHL